MGRRLDVARQIQRDIYDALRTIESNDLDSAPVERLLGLSSLAGELAAALNEIFCCRPCSDCEAESDPASEAHTARNEGRSPTE